MSYRLRALLGGVARGAGVVAVLLVSGSCETMRQVGKSIDRVAKGRAVDTKSIGSAMSRDANQIGKELQRLKREFDKTVAKLKGDIQQKWGQQEVKVANRTVYVKYTENYRSRAVVDFDKGTVTVESLDEKDPQGSLKAAIVSTLLTTSDPQGVDLFSDRDVALANGRQPYLYGLILDDDAKPVQTREQAERLAASLVRTQMKTRTVQTEKGSKSAHYVKVPMVSNFETKKAERYRVYVMRYAEQYKISPSLVYAIIRTESNFNPFAVSSAPAYGLMQLVPSSGGRAAYKRAKGSDQMPTPDYLFDPERNIELGTAYLNVLSYNEMEKIANPVSRDYCVISAYNTGPGNVLRTFSKNQVTAVNEINAMEPPALYERLRSSLPYDETRQYLTKVVGYRKQFVAVAPER
ncbi:MAG: murein transglycosylase domain-containing protein [Nitrospiraceae bacterium]